jgi:hypothetical protein
MYAGPGAFIIAAVTVVSVIVWISIHQHNYQSIAKKKVDAQLVGSSGYSPGIKRQVLSRNVVRALLRKIL